MTKEYILCAAIWYKEIEGKNLEIPLRQYLPVNCDSGIVFCGHRHLQCLRTMNSIMNLKQSEAGEEIQGFLTNLNRFVDRKEGLQIAFKANQLLEPHLYRTQLYSEDLY